MQSIIDKSIIIETFNKYMISIENLISQRILHYIELTKLKEVNDFDSQKQYQKFANAFANSQIAKDRDISMSLRTLVNLDDILKKDDEKNVTRHVDDDEKDDDQYMRTNDDEENDEDDDDDDEKVKQKIIEISN